MHTCMHSFIPAYLPTYLHTYIHTYIYEYMHGSVHVCMHIRIHSCMHIEDSEAQLGADGGAGPPPIDLGMASGALKVVDAATMILERNTIHDR